MDDDLSGEVPVLDTSPETLDVVSAWTDVRVFVSRLVLAVVAGLALWPALFGVLGMNVTTIRSGSMEPTIMTGDVVAASAIDFDDIQPGQIVTVEDPLHEGGLLTHRVVDLDDGGRLVTRGDANATPDSSHVEAGDAWLGRLRVPWIGYPVVWLHEGAWGALALTGLGLAAVVRGSSTRPLVDRGRPVDARSGRHARGVRRHAPAITAAIACGLSATLVGLASTGTSGAALVAQSTTAASTWSAAALASLGAYGDAVVADRPFFYFRMDEDECGVVLDSSGNGRTSFYNGAAGCDEAGAFPTQSAGHNHATAFLGTASLGSNRTYPSIDAMTFEAFVKFDSYAHSSTINTLSEFVTPTGWRDRLTIEYGSFVYQASPAAPKQYLQGAAHGDGVWHYVAISMTGRSVSVKVDDFWWSGTVDRAADSVARLSIGTHDSPYADPSRLGPDSSVNFKGSLDEVALYQYALTREQMDAHYAASTPR
jgi:signal peptidase